MPLKVCLSPHCASLATYRGRCWDHARQQDKGIDRAGRSIYGLKRWKVLRRRKLYLNPLCESPGCDLLAVHVHHKHGVEADPWSLSGLESLCHSHHSRLTRQTQLEMP